MSGNIKLKLTQAGINACLSIQETGINITLQTVRFSSDRFESNINDPRTTIDNVVFEASIASGGKSTDNNALRFFSVVETPQGMEIGSLGIFDENGVLFAVASVSSGYLLKFMPRISFILSFGLVVSAFDISEMEVIVDDRSVIASQLIIQHEQHDNPHPQYALNINQQQGVVNQLIDQIGRLQLQANQIETTIGGSVSSGAIKFFTRAFDAQTTPLPIAPNISTTQKHHVKRASVHIMPNGYIRQTLHAVIYGTDEHAFIFLPISIRAEDILSITGSPFQAEVVNDAGFRVLGVQMVTIGSSPAQYMTLNIIVDRLSPKKVSPYSGHNDVYIEVLGRHFGLSNYNNMDIYPYSTY